MSRAAPGVCRCGAPPTPSCAELFERLLALDHERREPWAALHAVSVACYLLQHPERDDDAGAAGRRAIVSAFCRGGLGAVRDLTRSAVARNSHRHARDTTRPWPDRPAPTPPSDAGACPSVTIHDVAVDETFPAAGFSDRVLAWARDVAVPNGDSQT